MEGGEEGGTGTGPGVSPRQTKGCPPRQDRGYSPDRTTQGHSLLLVKFCSLAVALYIERKLKMSFEKYKTCFRNSGTSSTKHDIYGCFISWYPGSWYWFRQVYPISKQECFHLIQDHNNSIYPNTKSNSIPEDRRINGGETNRKLRKRTVGQRTPQIQISWSMDK